MRGDRSPGERGGLPEFGLSRASGRSAGDGAAGRTARSRGAEGAAPRVLSNPDFSVPAPQPARSISRVLISLDARVRNSLSKPLGVCGWVTEVANTRLFFLNKTLLVIVFKYVYNSTLFKRKSRPSQHTG